VSHLRPYYYWSEVRVATSSNSQWPYPDPLTGVSRALRENDDTYVRSKWAARLSYISPGTASVPGWWGFAQVRLVISEDPQAVDTPSDVGDNDPLTLAFTDLQPRWWPIRGSSTSYLLDWVTEPTGVIHQTRRDFVDAGHKPQILASIFAYDQNGMFGLSGETAPLLRAQITGRVLWESTNNGL
jgi:hypothetical protein